MDKQIIIKTITPISIPSFLKVGINTHSPEYAQLIQEIDRIDKDTISFNDALMDVEYKSLDNDVKDIRIFKWTDPESESPLSIHLFPNAVGIVEIDLHIENSLTSEEIEAQAQLLSKQLISHAYRRFLRLLNRIDNALNHHYWSYQQCDENAPLRIYWISRALILTRALIKPSSHLIVDWLSETKYPQDAQQIIAGKLDCSMTWLNYVVVDLNDAVDYRIDAMILAQYYYTAQDNCNNNLKQAIDIAYRNTQIKQAEAQLSSSRVATRLHYISYHEQLKYLTRNKRALLIAILSAWEFEELVENGLRMVDVCSSKLDAVDIERRERSTMMTDLLLVALSFFTVFELSLSLTEFSREMMSRPALDYHDDKSSTILGIIANIDVDTMFSLGFGLTLFLIIIYRIMKR